jgi:hypothetical protein
VLISTSSRNAKDGWEKGSDEMALASTLCARGRASVANGRLCSSAWSCRTGKRIRSSHEARRRRQGASHEKITKRLTRMKARGERAGVGESHIFYSRRPHVTAGSAPTERLPKRGHSLFDLFVSAGDDGRGLVSFFLFALLPAQRAPHTSTPTTSPYFTCCATRCRRPTRSRTGRRPRPRRRRHTPSTRTTRSSLSRCVSDDSAPREER